MLQKYIGDRPFYRQLLKLSVPIMIQNGITAFVNMLDNIMVGSVGEAEMTGVAVANQLIFIFNLCIFGILSGAGLFSAQFKGKSDHEGIRHTFRFKMIAGIGITVLVMGVFYFFGEPLCKLYMQGSEGNIDPVKTLEYAYEYLVIMLIGLIPYTVSQCYASTQRDMSLPMSSMVAGVVATGVNLVLNLMLIFGVPALNIPALGVAGAAIATVIARFVEMAIVVIWTHTHKKVFPFIQGAYRSLYVPKRLVGQIIVKGFPLMLNETVWALGIAVLGQCYSMRGLDVVAAHNIVQTFLNVFAVTFRSAGVAIGIILGQLLGAKKWNQAKEESPKMVMFSVFLGLLTGIAFAACAGFIPNMYEVPDAVRSLASILMLITACVQPLEAYVHSSYFILRSGGRTGVTILFDCGYTWFLCVPVAAILSYLTATPIVPLYAIVQALTLIKCFAGGILVKKGIWIRNIVDTPEK